MFFYSILSKKGGKRKHTFSARRMFLIWQASVVHRSTYDIEQFVGNRLLATLVVLQVEFP